MNDRIACPIFSRLSRKDDLFLLIALAFAVGIYLYDMLRILQLPISTLVSSRSIDDTFYYLNVARNWTAGRGLSFDGINSTNGVQWGWFSFVSLLSLLIRDHESLFRATLALAATLSLGTIGLSFALRKHIGPTGALAASVWLWCISRHCIFNIGIESNLNLFAVVGAFLFLCSWAARHPRPSPLITAVVVASLVWIRIDNILIASPIFIAIASFYALDKQRTSAVIFLLLVGIMVLLIPSINYLTEGHALQVSGLAKSVHEGHRSIHDATIAQAVAMTWRGIERVLRMWLFSLPVVICSFTVFFRLAAGFVYSKWRSPLNVEGLSLLCCAFVGGGIHLVATKYAFRYANMYLWHNVGSASIIVLSLCGLMSAYDRIEKPWIRLALNTALLSNILFAGLLYWGGGYRTREMLASSFNPYLYRDRYEAALRIKDYISPGERVGSWNAGQLGYFSGVQVVNLDGLVNSARFLDVLQSRKYHTFLREQNIGWIVDYKIEYWWSRFSDDLLNKETIAVLPATHHDSYDMEIARIRDVKSN
jgi:hypothetical protein